MHLQIFVTSLEELLTSNFLSDGFRRGGLIPWKPKEFQLDFFFWGYVKGTV
jgi:hypothetical protein